MTKLHYKKMTLRVINTAVLLGLVLPTAFSFAKVSTSTITEKATSTGENFCTRAVEQLGKVAGDITDRVAKLQE